LKSWWGDVSVIRRTVDSSITREFQFVSGVVICVFSSRLPTRTQGFLFQVHPTHPISMNFEHIAFNVADPVAVADWYVRHLGLRVVRHVAESHQVHFIADEASTVLEIYNNPPDQVPDYHSMDPLLFHLAFASSDPEADAARLVAAGATFATEVRPDAGTLIITLRDPWGLCFQLCKRARPLL
jgi:catechol 2,3-dioxygenase-like lactoylglutathione lyase family enzyme